MDEWLVLVESVGEWSVEFKSPDLQEARDEARALYDDNRVILVSCSEIANSGIGQIYNDFGWQDADA